MPAKQYPIKITVKWPPFEPPFYLFNSDYSNFASVYLI